MRYTENGLQISLADLRTMLECAENRAQFGNMESCIYIKGGEQPKITQYCIYAECNAIDHTYSAKKTTQLENMKGWSM